MKRLYILNRLSQIGVIAVIRGKTSEQGRKICEALIAGGVKGLEITFILPNANNLMAELVAENKHTDVVSGAGNVLDATTARLTIMSGAEFIVSPTFDVATAKL